jgi:hypothetical protein
MKNILFLFCIILTGCYYDKAEELYGAGTCDVTTVNYSTTVSGLLNNYGCVSCHSGSAPSGNINLQNFTGVKTVAQNGKLFGAINHSPGFSPMPKGGGKMSACEISKIKAWIDAGAVNN